MITIERDEDLDQERKKKRGGIWQGLRRLWAAHPREVTAGAVFLFFSGMVVLSRLSTTPQGKGILGLPTAQRPPSSGIRVQDPMDESSLDYILRERRHAQSQGTKVRKESAGDKGGAAEETGTSAEDVNAEEISQLDGMAGVGSDPGQIAKMLAGGQAAGGGASKLSGSKLGNLSLGAGPSGGGTASPSSRVIGRETSASKGRVGVASNPAAGPRPSIGRGADRSRGARLGAQEPSRTGWPGRQAARRTLARTASSPGFAAQEAGFRSISPTGTSLGGAGIISGGGGSAGSGASIRGGSSGGGSGGRAGSSASATGRAGLNALPEDSEEALEAQAASIGGGSDPEAISGDRDGGGTLGLLLAQGPVNFKSGATVQRSRQTKSSLNKLEGADIISDKALRFRGDADANEGGSLPFDSGSLSGRGRGDPLLEEGDIPYDDLDRPRFKKKAYRGPLGPDGRPYEDLEDENADELNPPAEPPAQDTTPWRKLSEKAQKLILAATALILAAYLASFIPLIGKVIAMGLAGAAAALAGAVTAIGMILMAKHGQMLSGAMFTLTGGILTWQAIQAVRGYYDKYKLGKETKPMRQDIQNKFKNDKFKFESRRGLDGKAEIRNKYAKSDGKWSEFGEWMNKGQLNDHLTWRPPEMNWSNMGMPPPQKLTPADREAMESFLSKLEKDKPPTNGSIRNDLQQGPASLRVDAEKWKVTAERNMDLKDGQQLAYEVRRVPEGYRGIQDNGWYTRFKIVDKNGHVRWVSGSEMRKYVPTSQHPDLYAQAAKAAGSGTSWVNSQPVYFKDVGNTWLQTDNFGRTFVVARNRELIPVKQVNKQWIRIG